MIARRFIALMICATLFGRVVADERDADDFLLDGELKRPFKLVHIQSGGGFPKVTTTIEIDDDNFWEAVIDIAGRKTKRQGRLTKDQAKLFATMLAENDIWALPRETAGPMKWFEYPHGTPPRSSRIALTYGETNRDDRIHHTVPIRFNPGTPGPLIFSHFLPVNETSQFTIHLPWRGSS